MLIISLRRAARAVAGYVEDSLGCQAILAVLSIVAIAVVLAVLLATAAGSAEARERAEAAPYIARCSASDWDACEKGLVVPGAYDFCVAALAKRLEVKR